MWSIIYTTERVPIFYLGSFVKAAGYHMLFFYLCAPGLVIGYLIEKMNGGSGIIYDNFMITRVFNLKVTSAIEVL